MEINYSLDRLSQDKKGRQHIIDELLQIKSLYQISNKNIIELGCGLGQNLEVFKDSNIVLGIEGLEDVARLANNSGLNVRVANLEYPLTDIPDNSFDWVLCLDVLEHLVNPFGLTKEILRILKTDGKAIINVPNHFDWRGRFKILKGSDIDTKKFFPDNKEWNLQHLRFFTYKGFKEMIELAGLTIVENRSSHFNTFPFYVRFFSKFPFTQKVVRSICKKNTSLFAAGFFVIVQKRTV